MPSDESEGNAMLRGVAPSVSVIVANYNGSTHLADAIGSVLKQTLRDIEIIVVDDASTDASGTIIAALAATDSRIRAVLLTRNGGPARARNHGLALAQGTWIAIVDADDLIAPDRLEKLIAAADDNDAEIVADDLLYFVQGEPPHARLLPDGAGDGPLIVTAELLVRGRTAGGDQVAFGYLKPLIRRSALGQQLYDETLRIGEDYDLLLRLLMEGGRLCIVPEAMYYYRRHELSLSHRLSAAAVRDMIASQDRFVAQARSVTPELAAAFRQRRAELTTRLHFEELVSAIKSGRPWQALASIAGQPGLLLPLGQSVGEGLMRRVRGKVAG